MKANLHPLTQFMSKAISVFTDLGFDVLTEMPELEIEKYNFDFLRVPADHPSRDTQDTFWTKDHRVLRTHTTAFQGRYLKNHKPPLRVVVPGRCFRNEATDQSHEAQFYQLDALAIDKNITMSDLKGTLEHFIKIIYGRNTEVRFVPHHYPFVEPAMDVHMRWSSKSKWLEILGSGMVHPEILQNVGLDPKKWQGFAFGMGIDRLMMLYYGIDDIRLSYQNDLRFLKQFK